MLTGAQSGHAERGWSVFDGGSSGEDKQYENPLSHQFSSLAGGKGMPGAAKAQLKGGTSTSKII